MKPRYDRTGKLCFWMVLPTAELRRLVYRRLRQLYPELNYCLEWKDVRGYGLQLTVCFWKKPGDMYHVPD